MLYNRLAIALVVITLSSATFDSSNADISKIIVNKKTQGEVLEDRSLSIPELIDLFTRKKTKWSNGTDVIVVTRRFSSIEHKLFLQEQLGITPYRYRSRVQRNIYQGLATPPIEVDSEEELIEKVATEEGAIGYLFNYVLYRRQNELVIVDVKP